MSESDLCKIFLKNVPTDWAVFPEACGYDIVLVGRDLKDQRFTFQIGIQAKLTFNIKVLNQVLPYHQNLDNHPDYLAVLVPELPGRDARELANKCRVFIWTKDTEPQWGIRSMNKGMAWEAEDRLILPEFPAQIDAGTPCPRTLSAWKIGAIRISLMLSEKGRLESLYFTAHGQRTSLWIEKGWAKRISRGLYAPGDKPMPHVIFSKEGKLVVDDWHLKTNGNPG